MSRAQGREGALGCARLRALQAPLVMVACWAALEGIFTGVASHQGLLAPFGPVNLLPLTLGLTLVGLRGVGTFLLIPWCAWRLSGRREDRAGRVPPQAARDQTGAGSAFTRPR